jgi:N-acetylmuramoyl-L-alanine amidase CwlA
MEHSERKAESSVITEGQSTSVGCPLFLYPIGSDTVNIKTNLANKGNYGSARDTSVIKYIVVHYTGNDGDTDENNGNYFKNNVVEASAHYFVDDDSITQTVPDNYAAWHCGAKTYKHDYCRNTNSLGVEICDDVRNGVIYPSEKTIENALELVNYLMRKYNVPKENVIRHYDVTGKLCPAYWCGTKEKDAKWISAFWSRLEGSNGSASTNASKEENAVPGGSVGVLYRVQVGAYSKKANAEKQLQKIKAAGFTDAYIAIVDNILFRVQVGAYSEKANAEKQLANVIHAGFSGFVTKLSGTVAKENKEVIQAGSIVMVKGGAPDYNGNDLASYVYDRKHMVKEVSGDRAVIVYNGIVVAAVHKDNLFLV